jgi:hypothetical protein
VTWQGYQARHPDYLGPLASPGDVQVLHDFIFHKIVHRKVPGPFEFVMVPESQKYENECFSAQQGYNTIKMDLLGTFTKSSKS